MTQGATSGSRYMIAALSQAGVKPEPRYTEFPGVDHGSWGPAYEKPDLWDCLSEQRRAKPCLPME